MSSVTYTPSNSSTYHDSSIELDSPINQAEKLVALIERFGRWPAYLTGDPIDSRGNELFIPIVALGSLAIISTAARVYVRGWVVKSVGWDDYTMLVALAATMVFNALYAWAVKAGGLGRYEIDVPLEMWPVLFKATFLNPIMYHICIAFLKASICLFLLRIATVKIYRQILWGTLIFSSISLFGFMVVTSFQCDYMDLFMGKKTNPYCLSPLIVEKCSFASAAVNIVTDFLVVILPIPMLWHVSISRRKKFLIRLILSLGLFASFATVIRLIYILVWPPYGNFTRRIEFEIWSVIELNCGITVANIPALAPLIKGFLERRKNSPNGSPNNSNNRNQTPPRFGLIKLPNRKTWLPVKSLRHFQVSFGRSLFSTKGGGDSSEDGSGNWSWGSGSTTNGSTAGYGKKVRVHEKRSSDLTSLTTIEDTEKSWFKGRGTTASHATSNVDSLTSIYDKYRRSHQTAELDTLSSMSSNRTMVAWSKKTPSQRGGYAESIAESEGETVRITKTTSISMVDEEVPPGTAVSPDGREVGDEMPIMPRKTHSYVRRV
ncbi:hypothetical protein ABW19_dt0205726 [Dactylella cylindrospora]|nr:hypothetical protein ABW19_dt0205726 [Dactylella cylindrospora]